MSATGAALRRMGRRRGVAVVLSGGGNLGALQVGMLAALVERGVRVDAVFGCSVGAMNGAAFAADPTEAGVARLREHWTELSTDASSVMPSSFLPNPVQLLRRGESIHRSDGLRASIEAFLGPARSFEDLALPFECVATDVDRGVEQWFSAGPLIEPILASAALPSVFPMVTIGERRYIDGGVVDNVPLERAVEAGARTVYVLHCGQHGRPDATVRRPLDAALMAYWISRNHRLAHDLARVPRGVDVVVLPPGTRPELRFDDFGRTEQLIVQGHLGAGAYLDSLAAEPSGSAERSERLRRDVRRVVDDLRGRVGARLGDDGEADSP